MKTYAREVAGAVLVCDAILLARIFFASNVAEIAALSPTVICLGPIVIMCLGVFGIRSYQVNK